MDLVTGEVSAAALSIVSRIWSIASLKQTDVGELVAPRRARFMVFALLVQSVQTFMSYDGGALPASLNTIQAAAHAAGTSWSQAEFGLLGAMDKIGMVAASMPWGWLLQRCGAKWLLVFSLFVNTACSFAFGELRQRSAMYAVRFLMGATQALQGVWGTVWTVAMAPPEVRTMWLGLGAVSAGIGNGIGAAVAGFGTANGLPYAFAFQAQAVVLAALWLVQIVTPARWLQFRRHSDESDGESSENEDWARTASSGTSSGASSVTSKKVGGLVQLRSLYRNGVYFWTAMAIALIMFQVSALQFLWTQAFVTVWELDQNWVTGMFLVVTGAGSGVGIAIGPRHIDKRGGYGSGPGLCRSLGSLWWFALYAASAGFLSVLAVMAKAQEQHQIWGVWGDPWLYVIWCGVFALNAAQNGGVAALCGINLESVSEEMRPFASGAEITLRNTIGFTLGPLLPGFIMTQLQVVNGWSPADYANERQLLCGLAFVLASSLLSPVLLSCALREARCQLTEQRAMALRELRLAFAARDLPVLEQALRQARRVKLEWEDSCKTIMSTANHAVGQLRAELHQRAAPPADTTSSSAGDGARRAMAAAGGGRGQ